MKFLRRNAIFLLAGYLAVAASTWAAPQNTELNQAQKEAAAGHYAEAIQLYREVLSGEPDNPSSLGGLADALVAIGRWRDAITPLKHLLQLEPDNADRIFQLGQMESWLAGNHSHALELLKRATELQPLNAKFGVAYAEVLSWDSGRRTEALAVLHTVLSYHPDDVPAERLMALILSEGNQGEAAISIIKPLTLRQDATAEDFLTLGQVQESLGNNSEAAIAYRRALSLDPNNQSAIEHLAEILSWNAGTRPEAVTLFKRGLGISPDDADLLLPYADMLSWNRATRSEALTMYKKLLAADPGNARALDGEAQLQAWSGHSSEAMGIYEQVLRGNPNDVRALRGEGQILGWRGEYRRALNLLQQAHGLAPMDSDTMVELARAQYNLGRYDDARRTLSEVHGVETQDFDDVTRDVNQALGTYLEFGYTMRRDGQHLDWNSANAIVSTPLGDANRLSLEYQPTLYKTMPRSFNSNYFAAMLDSRPADRVMTHLEAAERTYPGVNSQVEGQFAAKFEVRPSFTLQTSVERTADQESLVSTLGAEVNGVFVGQVETNLGSISGSYSNSRHHFDASLTYTDGAYTGENLASNRRWSVDGNFGKSIHGDHPYLRVAYGFTYLSFDHDAEFEPGSGAPARVTGGYYSPTRFLLNYGQIYLSTPLGHHATWDAGGFAGAQNAETAFTAFGTPQFASTFSTHLKWSVTSQNDLRIGYEYLNVFNAFHRHLFTVAWRQYF